MEEFKGLDEICTPADIKGLTEVELKKDYEKKVIKVEVRKVYVGDVVH